MMLQTPHIDPNWCIVEDHFDVSRNRHNESVFSLGTGFMTTRASMDEGFADDDQSVEYARHMDNTTLEKSRVTKSRWGTFMPVIQGRHPTLRTGIVNLPYYLGLVITTDGESLDQESSDISGYCRWLDLHTATLYRRLTWKTRAGKTLTITWRRYMNPDQRFSCVQDVAITSDQAVQVSVESYVDNNVRTNGFDKFTRAEVGSSGDLIWSDVTTNLDNRVVTASRCVFNLLTQQQILPAERRISALASFQLEAGQTLQVRKLSFTATDAYFASADLLQVASRAIADNAEMDAHRLHAQHVQTWADLWEKTDIQIQAQDTPGYNSQLAIRSAIFHLIKAKGQEARGLLCPKGITTEMYYGSVFWDFEIFILPFFIYNLPEIARTGPVFRSAGLDAARRLARAYGYTGARYPWQSDAFGDETCVPWQYADHQVHISADVAIGIWHYVSATNDRDFLYNHGAEVIFETARYWVDRIDHLPGRPGAHILGVMGPDEYKPITNNNAFTNYTARLNLQLAVQVAAEMKANAPRRYASLIEKIGLSDAELASFSQVAAEISLPEDRERGIIWQCDDFETAFAEIDIAGLWTDRTRLFGFYVSQEKRYRSKVIKQADVLALLGVFPSSFEERQKAASFTYYEPFTIHDSSNSMTHRQMVAADLGWAEIAYESWLRAIDIDFGSLPRSNDGLHYANVGGMWQQIVFGFGGVASALNAGCLTFKPCLPEQIGSITFPLIWKGQKLRATVKPGWVSVENLATAPLEFTAGGRTFTVAPGQCVEATC